MVLRRRVGDRDNLGESRLGTNLFDTANMYSTGESKSIAGTRTRSSRRRYVYSTTPSGGGRSATSAQVRCGATSSGPPYVRTTCDGLSCFVLVQLHYNLGYREQEREVLPLCERGNVVVMPWSSLARGYLTRPHEEFKESDRSEVDPWILDNPYHVGGGREINERVQQLVGRRRDQHGTDCAHLAAAQGRGDGADRRHDERPTSPGDG